MNDGPDFDYFDPTCGGEPYYLEEDIGWGQCPECDSYLVNEGAESDGDGSTFDALRRMATLKVAQSSKRAYEQTCPLWALVAPKHS